MIVEIGTYCGKSTVHLGHVAREAGATLVTASLTPLGVMIQGALGAQGVEGMDEPYERLKELTRGRRIGQPELVDFVRGLGLPADVEERVAAMTPATYIGIAPQLVDLLD